MESLIKRDYDQVLNKQGKVTPISSGKNNPPPPSGYRVVSVKPPDHLINHQKTTLEELHTNKYRMKDGTRVWVRPN
jgi:hypothetical protein